MEPIFVGSIADKAGFKNTMLEKEKKKSIEYRDYIIFIYYYYFY